MLLKYLKTTENLRKLNCQFVSHDIEKWRADIGIMHIHVHINRGDEIKKTIINCKKHCHDISLSVLSKRDSFGSMVGLVL